MIYSVLESKVDLGYSVRSVEESVELCRQDMKVFTSLLDSRFVAGSSELYRDFKTIYVKEVLSGKTADFVDEMIRMRSSRISNRGGSLYVLEPDIKSGKGGLRDYHTAMWLLKTHYAVGSLQEFADRGLLKYSTLRSYLRALDYIFDLRHRVHILSQGKNEKLTYDLQRMIAEARGIRGTKASKPSEMIMKRDYTAAETVDSFCDVVMEKIMEARNESCPGDTPRTRNIDGVFSRKGGKVVTISGRRFIKDPLNIVKAFAVMKKHSLKLHESLKELIAEIVDKEDIEWNEESFSLFRSLFRDSDNLSETLKNMNRLGVLTSILPEFGKIRAKVQHDVYHVYTVDAHSLAAIEEIEKLKKGIYKKDFPFLTKIIRKADAKDEFILNVSLLLHDIGKGTGKDHSFEGARLARRICKKLKISRSDTDRITFLIKNHLLMAVTSQRRNTDDPVMLNSFSSRVGDVQNLNLLYLMTFADLRSVSAGGNSFSSWKNLLLKDLYDKCVELLSIGKRRDWKFAREIRSLKSRLIKSRRNRSSKAAMREFLSSLPESYFLSYSPEEISQHFRMIKGLGKKDFLTDHFLIEGYGIHRITVCTMNRTGLFSILAGSLSAAKFNILNANIFSSDRGYAIDSFMVQVPDNGDEDGFRYRFEDFERLLTLAFSQPKNFEELLKGKLRLKKSILDGEKPYRRPELSIDTEGSPDYSILEVYAEDRLGLLYDISSVISSVGLNIHFAKISTVGNRAQDIFYLADVNDSKITDRAELSALKRKIEAKICR
jgi:[protein-PII] uridylyltransferase